ncbi:methyltransferase domain-containing protein, partial [Salmonella enterica]|uniref:methyltransferase domain-containing protein n=1 Tax=Salmonella enterica TaxID=28901 RepID=UPI003CF4E3EE
GFFDKYIKGTGVDLGVGRIDSIYGADPVHPDVQQWDKDDGDATFMESVADNTYDYVHASHILEHIENPYLALRNWLRILKPGGYLIV